MPVGHSPPLASLFQGVPVSWQCLVCTFKNTVTRGFCGMCNTAKVSSPKTPLLLRETTSPFYVPVSCASACSSASSLPSVSFLRAIFDEQQDDEEEQKDEVQKSQDEEEQREGEAIPPLESMPELIPCLSPPQRPLQTQPAQKQGSLQPQQEKQFKRKFDDLADGWVRTPKPTQTLSSLPLPSLLSVFRTPPFPCSSGSAVPISSPSTSSSSCSVSVSMNGANVRCLRKNKNS